MSTRTYQCAAIMGLLNICFFDFGFCRFFGIPERFFLLCIGRAIMNDLLCGLYCASSKDRGAWS
jgi:hypothetical protein